MTIREWGWIASAPVIYLALLALGRWLKQRWRVRLGFFYHLFCLATALCVPLPFLPVPAGLVRGLTTAFVLLGTLFLLALVQRVVWEHYFTKTRNAPAPKFVGEVFNLVIFVIVLLLVLNGFYSIQIPGLLAGSGILAIILGLALQDTLGNILAGFALHFEKPYRSGDWLIVSERHAQVVELNWRATRLRTNDDVYLDIPNSQMAKAIIVNLTYPTPAHAMRLRVSLEYATPPNDAKDVLLHAAAQAAGVLKEPAPNVFVAEFGESAMVYEIKYWLHDHAQFNEITDAVRTHIWYELNRRAMRVALPVRTIQMGRAPAEPGEESRSSTRQLLRSRSLFASFTDAQIDTLIASARHGRYGRGEAIIEQDEPGDSMFVLLQGEADVLVEAHGHSTRVASLRLGDCFGEMSLLNGEPRSATVLALSDCEVMEIGKASLAETLQGAPELLESLSRMLARRRLENEGILARSQEERATAAVQEKYAASMLHRLKSFFKL